MNVNPGCGVRSSAPHDTSHEVHQAARFDSETPAARGYTVREARFADHAQIASLETRFGLLAKSYAEWSHLWLGNPVYRELRRDWPIGWVLEDRDRRIVGTMGNIPLPYQFAGRSILAASGRHWVAQPGYRGAALELLDRLVNQRHVPLYVNNTVSALAAAAVDAFGCPRVPVGVWDQTAFWITRHVGFCESFLRWKKYPFARMLSRPLAAATFLKERLGKAALGGSDVHVDDCSGFDQRFDDFWEAFTRTHRHLLLAVRTREMLQWHYHYALLDRRLWILTVTDGCRLLAYATFERKDKPEAGLTRMLLVDFQSLDGSTALLPPLLARALEKCRENGIHVLEHMGRWLEPGDVIDAAAPYRRKLSAWCFVYRAHDSALASQLNDRRAWAPSLYDGDASLCAGLVTRISGKALPRGVAAAVDGP